MANRLTQIATRTGDDGTTGLGDGSRVAKSHLRIAALGDVDELNSTLGVLLAEPLPDDVRQLLVVIQHELFNLGGELSIPGYALLKIEAVARLDEALAHYNAALPRLKEFILPAGTRSAAIAHVGRTVARRAERAVVALAGSDEVRSEARQYLKGYTAIEGPLTGEVPLAAYNVSGEYSMVEAAAAPRCWRTAR